jgi:hypothetical protein
MGYDLIAFSGGKAIRGPQCAGLLIGKKDLVAYALGNNSPHEDTLGRFSGVVSKIPGLTTEFSVPDVANHVPHMRVTWDPKNVSASPKELSVALRQSKPSIVIGASESGGGLTMNSFMLQPGEEKIIAERLSGILHAHAV